MKPERIQDEILALPGWKKGNAKKTLVAEGTFSDLSDSLRFLAEVRPTLEADPRMVEIRARGGHLCLVLGGEHEPDLTGYHLTMAREASDLLVAHGAANTNEASPELSEGSAA